MHKNIDEMAFLGYEYARSNGQTEVPDFKEEIELLAFNAGISNANIKLGLSITKIKCISSARLEQKPAETSKSIGLGYF